MFFGIGVFFVFGYSLVGLCVCCVVVFCVVLVCLVCCVVVFWVVLLFWFVCFSLFVLVCWCVV